MHPSRQPPNATPNRGSLRRLETRFLKPFRTVMLLALLGMLAQSVLLLPVPLLHGLALDRLVARIEQGEPAPEADAAATRTIALALAVSVACYLARTALAWKATGTMSRVSLEVVRGLTDAMHRKLQRLPIAYYDREQTGRLMSRITSDVGSLLIFLNSGSLQLVSSLVLAVGISVALVWLQWRLALVSFLVLPLYVVNHRFFAGRIQGLSRAVRAQVASLYALLSERISAVRVVRSFAQEEAEVVQLDAHIDAHLRLSEANLRAGAFQGALATLVSGLGTVAVLVYGVQQVQTGALSVGELLAFYALLGQLYNPIVHLTQFHGIITATRVAVDRIVEVLDEPETLTDRPDAQPIRQPRGALQFSHASFRYGPDGADVLQDVSLAIEPGMTVGILGPSGAGKTTLLTLAPRLYEVPEGQGEVRFDGEDVRRLRLADLRRAVVLVPQQAMLFEGTIRSNLTYANPAASKSAIARALEIADLAELVEGLPEGLETPVGERGFTLSGGQRQRLALARALIADPSVLLLDDCTSALDADTEARIQTALAELLPGRTRVIVSHKVSSVCHADRIVVLEQGRVVEEGSHDDLLALDGWYARACRQQMPALNVPL